LIDWGNGVPCENEGTLVLLMLELAIVT